MTPEGRFGKLLDEALGDGPPDSALRVQRANVLAAARRSARVRLRWELAAGVLAAGAVVVALVVWRGRSNDLNATFRGAAALGAEASVLAGERAEPIEFSDGSRVLLQPQASARVVRLEPRHAELALRGGRINASVRHRDGVSWSVLAGPYEVRVVGTKFTVDWEPASETIRVSVTEGRVRVTGGELGARPVELEPGQRLERSGTPTPAAPPASAEAAAPPALRRPETLAPPVAAATPSAPVPVPTVGALAQAGKYREALALAEQRGFERVIGELPEGELLALGNAARYAGSATRGRQAMLALRERFPGRPASELAAFYLAKIAEQLDKNPREAARWLRVFLTESPTGGLAADARASLLSILLAAGDTPGATAVARDYLRYHPTGPIAERARSLVSRSEAR